MRPSSLYNLPERKQNTKLFSRNSTVDSILGSKAEENYVNNKDYVNRLTLIHHLLFYTNSIITKDINST